MHDVVQRDGRTCIVYERIHGPSMWSLIRDDHTSAPAMGVALADLHLAVLTAAPPMRLPLQRDRLASKLRQARPLIDDVRLAAFVGGYEMGGSAADRLSLCHGDLHPGNVIIADDGLVPLDWFDSSRGDRLTDVARSSVLMGAGGLIDASLPHLPGADPGTLRNLHDAYLSRVVEALGGIDVVELHRQRIASAAARVTEGLPSTHALDLLRAEVGP